jgi:hypothetical protein
MLPETQHIFRPNDFFMNIIHELFKNIQDLFIIISQGVCSVFRMQVNGAVLWMKLEY